MRNLPTYMLLPGILLLLVATSADDRATQKRSAVHVAAASVRIIRAERVAPVRNLSELKKQDRQIREREKKPMIEFY